MIIKSIRTKKALAIFFLSLLVTETLLPLRTLALTSGPAQPEHTQFSPAGTSDMVDLFSGAFKYNIPLLDVDGYPVNLNYSSGSGIDDEASWVGLGWNLNVGAINRQLRGVADDFNGDAVNTESDIATKYIYGGTGTARAEIFGGNVLGLSGSVSIGIFSDSYYGMGAEFGLNAGLTLGGKNTGPLTAGLNAGVNSNTRSGVSTTLGASLGVTMKTKGETVAAVGSSATLGYNTREGYKDLTLGVSFKPFGYTAGLGAISNSYIYNTPPFNPKINIGFYNENKSFSLDIGGTAFGIFGGFGFTGYMSTQRVADNNISNGAYGYLYADKGKNVPRAIMDFQREKDNPVIPNLPNLAVPVATPDVFTYTSQAGSGQFRLNRGNAGVVFDTYAEDKNSGGSLSVEYGMGAYFHGGVSLYQQDITNKSGKWVNENDFLSLSDYPTDESNPVEEQAYFKMQGELTPDDNQFARRIMEGGPVSVALNNKRAMAELRDKRGNAVAATGLLKKTGRQIRSTSISYLTAEEATVSQRKGFESYSLLNPGFTPGSGQVTVTKQNRISETRKKNHISEITVTEPDGKRAVYGLPVYNIRQDEYSFSIPSSAVTAANKKKNLADVSITGDNIKHDYGREKFYQHTTQPGYASSFLLTAILSPDYVDVTNDGITDDDLGTAIKFNYSKLDKNYSWRTPMATGKAQYNGGLLADPEDDKGSIIKGDKEVWYLHSIETKNKIAYFITKDRDDAYGVKDLNGTIDPANKLRCLKEIHLYSKSDLQRPVKKVIFNYDTDMLCKGVPNSLNQGGKLTLKNVWFTNNSSERGQYHPYTFFYNNEGRYEYMSSDRWGGYKPWTDNGAAGFGNMANDEFPYTVQDTALANHHARQWNLSRIELPTGGTIKVDYEANDYAYVQDRKAMEMTGIVAFIKDISGVETSSLTDAHGFKLKAPGPLRGDAGTITRYFIQDYLNGRNDFYARLNVNITDKPSLGDPQYFENISCYAEVAAVKDNKDGTINVTFKDISEGGVSANPFVMAAWQRMRIDYPIYAYPGYQNRISNDAGIREALSALVNAIGNLSELRESFYERAARLGFCAKVERTKSFVRMVRGDGKKLGGGARVKRLRMEDNWNSMSASSAPAAVYGQEYEYTTQEDNKEISSGVASYEPYVGADENPMRMPVPYSQESRGALTSFFYLEEPFGESLFPAPQVGYRNVKVKQLGEGGKVGTTLPTGYTQYEFYTAKDFPVIVESMAKPDRSQYGPSGWGSFTGGSQVYELAMSQGYVVWLNDMHGKAKAERTFNQSGSEISSTITYYKTEPLDAGKLRLSSKVTTVDEKGRINREDILGRQVEMVTDMRESESNDVGESIHLGVDVIPFIFIGALPIPHWPRSVNDSYRLFRSASTLKTIQQTGIVDRVVKTINGSTSTAANLVFDRLTGQPVVTSTDNEFEDPVYTVNMPAYWKYTGMSGAFKNANTILNVYTTNGVVTVNDKLLAPGDELLPLNESRRLWVVSSATQTDPVQKIRLIDDAGNVVPFNGPVKVYRSGYRNQTGGNTATIATLTNPVAGSQFALNDTYTQQLKVLDAKTVLYEEAWGAPKDCDCPPGSVPAGDGKNCIILPTVNNNDTLTLIRPLPSSEYGKSGGRFYDVNNEWHWAALDNFYGGNCSNGGGTTQFLKTAPVQRMAKSGDTTGATARMASFSSLVVNDSTCGRMNYNRFWLKNVEQAPVNTWFGVETCIQTTMSGKHAIGFGIDNYLRVYIDDVLLLNWAGNPKVDDYNYWTIWPLNMTAGKHRLRLEFCNSPGPNGGYAGGSAAAAEIYTASPDQMMTFSVNQVKQNTIFQSASLFAANAKYNTYVVGADGSMRIVKYTCGSGRPNICDNILNCGIVSAARQLNPYILGLLGNWRVSEEKAYLVNREDQGIFQRKGEGLNIRSSGAYRMFNPYWICNNTTGIWQSSTAANWTTTRAVTGYDKYGQEAENKDALGRYSSALYGYNSAVPVAVASNSMKREVFYDGFEDYNYLKTSGGSNCNVDSFSIPTFANAYTLINNDAHSGNYCIRLNRSLELVTNPHSLVQQPGYGNYTAWGTGGEFLRKLGVGIYPAGFQPVSGKNYVVSLWVKDNAGPGANPNISISTTSGNITLQKKAAVEGWKLMEGTVTIGNASSFSMSLNAAGLLVDDIRIFPYAGVVKTYAYDDKSLRLMAEMDENNFSTFYEYDDEGQLIRVKKETERGIMTLKESRAVMLKKPSVKN
ncbi:hypothetical protein [Chitinophaga solisilvae]|uniref:hypothetical protein n=1 Tax=Chitinophaga solisilvae TaxID=1233460 RepID=UPI00136B5AA1|nr:hypothetical protein [Chitinophaga solisilvae]